MYELEQMDLSKKASTGSYLHLGTQCSVVKPSRGLVNYQYFEHQTFITFQHHKTHI